MQVNESFTPSPSHMRSRNNDLSITNNDHEGFYNRNLNTSGLNPIYDR